MYYVIILLYYCCSWPVASVCSAQGPPKIKQIAKIMIHGKLHYKFCMPSYY